MREQSARLPPTRDPAQQAAAVAHLRAADPVLARLIARVGPPTIRHEPDYFAALVGTIVGQQISVRAAASVRARLAACFHPERPTPAGVLALGEAGLRACGLSQAKARYVLDLAARVHGGQLDLAALDALDDEAVIQRLTVVKGIGRWSAEMLLIFGLGRPDVLPVDDLGFRAAVRREYGLDTLPRAAALRALAEPWRPWRTFATWYLWRSAAQDPTVVVPPPPDGATARPPSR
jgi:DNA-3-methyladenine glycosylase II